MVKKFYSSQINKLRDEARAKKQVTNSDKPQIIESFEKLTEKEEDEKKMQYRTDFLDQLYKLVDGHILPDTRKYVIIFNTNQFDSLFVGVDSRYDALMDRFEKYKFNMIGKPEIIHYLKCINDILQNYVRENTISNFCQTTINYICINDECIYDTIPADIKLTYRALHKLLRMHGFRIRDTIQAMVNSTQKN